MSDFTDDTRLFFVVEGVDTNEEIFETLETATSYFHEVVKEDKARVYVGLVRNAYEETDRSGKKIGWNYEDFSNTFTIIKDVTPEVRYLVKA
jgi:hypothetical protein